MVLITNLNRLWLKLKRKKARILTNHSRLLLPLSTKSTSKWWKTSCVSTTSRVKKFRKLRKRPPNLQSHMDLKILIESILLKKHPQCILMKIWKKTKFCKEKLEEVLRKESQVVRLIRMDRIQLLIQSNRTTNLKRKGNPTWEAGWREPKDWTQNGQTPISEYNN